MSHPTPDDLRAFARGQPVEDASTIEAHLGDCPACCERLSDLEAEDGFLVRLRTLAADPNGATSVQSVEVYDPSRETTLYGPRKATAPPLPSVPGYAIQGEIGRGGVGVVYRAHHLRLNRVVALKLIRAGALAGLEERVRFLAEAQAIAQVRHPNIIQVFDVGEHEGIPYCALEFMAGGSLADHVRNRPQPPRLAAALIEAMARGVQAAHAAGIVHRDLKPANVLLEDRGAFGVGRLATEAGTADGAASAPPHRQTPDVERPTPKIADFGMAKWLDRDSGLTQSGTVAGTPSYMAPEQAAGQSDRVGPTTDVYSLGAILYELLCGRPPFHGPTVAETLVQVRGDEPIPPSRLQPTTPRDLETICLKCLRKDPAKRYGSAQELAEDARRFLDGEPIRARPVGALERAAKWARRRPGIAATLAGAVAVLVLATAVSTTFGMAAKREARRAREAEALATTSAQAAREAEALATTSARDARAEAEKARKAAADTQAVLTFFNDSILAASRPLGQDGGLGTNTTIRQAILAAEPKVADAFRDQPHAEAAVRHTLGRTFGHWRDAKRSVRQFERGLELAREMYGPDHAETYRMMGNLGAEHLTAERPDLALPLLEVVQRDAVARYGPTHLEALAHTNNLAHTYLRLNRMDEARTMLEGCRDTLATVHGRDHKLALLADGNLAAFYHKVGEHEKARYLIEHVVARLAATAGPDHPDTLSMTTHLANAYFVAGEGDRGMALLKRVAAKRRFVNGPEHPYTLGSIMDAIAAHEKRREFAESEPLRVELLAWYRKERGTDHQETAMEILRLGQLRLGMRKFEPAERDLREATQILETNWPTLWPRFVAKQQLGMCLLEQKKFDEAEPLLVESFAGMKAVEATMPPNAKTAFAVGSKRIVAIYEAAGMPEKAAVWRTR